MPGQMLAARGHIASPRPKPPLVKKPAQQTGRASFPTDVPLPQLGEVSHLSGIDNHSHILARNSHVRNSSGYRRIIL